MKYSYVPKEQRLKEIETNFKDAVRFIKQDVDNTIALCEMIETKNKPKPKLEKIWYNPKKKLITTKTNKDEVIKVTPGEGDTFDPYIGVALAYCYQQFGSKSKFKKAVEQLVGEDVIKTYIDNMKPVTYIHCEDGSVYRLPAPKKIKIVKQDTYQKGDLVEIYTYAELDESISSGLTVYEHSAIKLYGGQRKIIGMACPDINTYFFKNGTNTISDDIIKGKIIKGKVVKKNND